MNFFLFLFLTTLALGKNFYHDEARFERDEANLESALSTASKSLPITGVAPKSPFLQQGHTTFVKTSSCSRVSLMIYRIRLGRKVADKYVKTATFEKSGIKVRCTVASTSVTDYNQCYSGHSFAIERDVPLSWLKNNLDYDTLSGSMQFGPPLVLNFGDETDAGVLGNAAQCVLISRETGARFAGFRVNFRNQAEAVETTRGSTDLKEGVFLASVCPVRVPIMSTEFGVNEIVRSGMTAVRLAFKAKSDEALFGDSYQNLVGMPHPDVKEHMKNSMGLYFAEAALRCLESETVDKTIPIPANEASLVADEELRLLGGDAAARIENMDLPALPWIKGPRQKCPAIFAHRAVIGRDATRFGLENTSEGLRSFPQAHLKAIDGIEVDVYLFKSRKAPNSFRIIISHDDHLGRLLGVDGDISKLPSVEDLDILKKVTGCRSMFEDLEVYLRALKDRPRLKVDLDLKPESPLNTPWSSYAEDMGKHVGALIRRLGVTKQVVATAFDAAKIEYFNKGVTNKNDQILVGLGVHNSLDSKAYNAAARLFKLGGTKVESARIFQWETLKQSDIQAAHARGEPVGVYTIFDNHNRVAHDPALITKLVGWGVDWVETDQPAKLREFFRTRLGCYIEYDQQVAAARARLVAQDPAKAVTIRAQAKANVAALIADYTSLKSREALFAKAQEDFIFKDAKGNEVRSYKCDRTGYQGDFSIDNDDTRRK